MKDGKWDNMSIAYDSITGVVGGSNPLRIFMRNEDPRRWYHKLKDGGVVRDVRNAEEKLVIHELIHGPTLDDALPDDSMRETLHGDILAYNAERVSFMTTVSLNVYTQRWISIGARVGIRRDKFIVWFGGTTEAIE